MCKQYSNLKLDQKKIKVFIESHSLQYFPILTQGFTERAMQCHERVKFGQGSGRKLALNPTRNPPVQLE